MSVTVKLAVVVFLIVASMVGGWFARHRGLLREHVANVLMTIVAVFGYPAVGFLSVWATPLGPAEFWLTTQAVLHMAIMTVIGLAVARYITRDRSEQGLLGISAAVGNNGFTMGGFIIYLLFGENALGLANIYFLLFSPAVILLHYPIARRYAGHHPHASLVHLMVRNLLDWRSIGLPMTVASIVLSLKGVPRPAFVSDWRVLDILMFTITPMAYFAIGLRFHGSDFVRLWRQILALAGLRFIVALAVGVGLFALTMLTPWPMQWGSLNMKVCIIESFVPMAVTVVAVASMFGLRPREASMLFVANTMMYLVLIMPFVMWVFGR